MRISLLIATVSLLALLLAVNRLGHPQDGFLLAGLPWSGWSAAGLVLLGLALIFMRRGADRTRQLLGAPAPDALKETRRRHEAARERRKEYDPNGPDYPHPVVVADRCIACGQCVEACPHDVLTVIDRSGGKGHVAAVAR